MYIIKNAMKNLCRSKGRNLLIGIIVFVIARICMSWSINSPGIRKCKRRSPEKSYNNSTDFSRQRIYDEGYERQFR